MGLQQFERRLERLVEGVFAKAFRSGLQPVEIGRRLAREMDLRRTAAVRGPIAPNTFTVLLAPADRERFSGFEGAFASELAEAAREHAREEGYGFVGPVTVIIHTDDNLSSGTFLVAGEIQEPPGGAVGAVVLADGRRVQVGATPVVVGRLPECEVVLSDPNVSRRHAQFERDGFDVFIADLQSTNGTRLNGTKIRRELVRHGDEVVIGGTTLRFEAS